MTTSYRYDSIYKSFLRHARRDHHGNYTSRSGRNRTASLGVSSYTTNSSNEMTANSNASFTYDNNGNTLTKVVGSDTTTYAWDYETRVTSVTLPGSGGNAAICL